MNNPAHSITDLRRGLAIGDGWHLALPPATDVAVANKLARDVYGWEDTAVEHTGGALLVRPKRSESDEAE